MRLWASLVGNLVFTAVLAGALPASARAAETYALGVSERLAGHNARAVELLRQAVAERPGNADAYLQLGLALLAVGRFAEAEAALRQTLVLAPNYADARIGLARLAQRRGDLQSALAQLEGVDAANPEAAVLRKQLATTRPVAGRWRVDVDGSLTDLDRNQSDWREVDMQLSYRINDTVQAEGRVEAARRFGVNDIYTEGRLSLSSRGGQTAYVIIGMTPDADFRPLWQIGLGGAAKIRKGGSATVLTIDAREARYRVGDIQTLNPGIEQYFADGRFWVTAKWINLFDENRRHRSGYSLRSDALASDRLRLFAGYADAPDTSEGVVLRTKSVFGGFDYRLTARTTIRAAITDDNPNFAARRLTFALGGGLSF